MFSIRKVLIAVSLISCGVLCVEGQNTAVAADDSPLQLLRKPKPAYTDSARRKGLEGTVVLRVTLLSTGEIGEIVDLTKKKREKMIKRGLTQSAINAAMQIQFVPERKNGVPITVTRIFEYTFTIY